MLKGEPIVCPSDLRIPALSEERPVTKQGQTGGIVLIVDDEAEIVEDIVEHLEYLGYSTRTALSGSEALLRLSENSQIRVCLTDIRMPEMDGMDLLNHMRQRDPLRFRELRWIMLTGHATPADEQAALTAGVSNFLRKPCSLSEITAAVEQAFSALSAADHHCDEEGRTQVPNAQVRRVPETHQT